MNTEQEREAFEDWILQGMDKNLPGHQNTLARYPSGNYMTYSIAKQWDSWQARAALQSQDREDAERYRAWRKAAATNNGNFLRLVSNELPDWDEGPVDESRVDAAIDHARRIEGDGE